MISRLAHYGRRDQGNLVGTTNPVDPGRRDYATHGYISAKDSYLKRLKRIEGQSRGLQRMVEEERCCIDILTQISAMKKALHSVAMELLEDHLSHCVVDAAARGGAESDAKIREAAAAIRRLVNS